MKHPLLSLALVFAVAIPAQGQRLQTTCIVRTEGTAPLTSVTTPDIATSNPGIASRALGRQNAKMTGAAFYTQTFPSFPAGWSVTTNPGCVNGWRWANSAPTGTGNNFPINGLISSSSKSNGWLLYNADSVLNNAGSVRPFGGAITSTAIPVGASHSNVMLSFQQYYRYSTGDSCFVDVSSDGTTWTSFLIYPNVALTQFGFLYSDPTTTTINISPIVGGQPNAYIRFRFNSTAPTYSFNWLIDDLMLYDADATDLGITYSGIASASSPLSAGFTNSHSYSSIPLQLADTVYPITYLSNYGLNAASSTAITANYYLNNNLLATETVTVPISPVGARDSAVVFNTGYRPTTTGNYVIALNIAPTGDGTAWNNVDTIRFAVTDTSFATHGTKLTERNCFLNRPSASTMQYWGARFTISNGQRDTLTSVSVAFRPETAPGERVQAQLYQASGSGTTFSWVPITSSATKTLNASDISTPGNLVTTTIPLRLIGGSFNPLVLGDGDYAIVLSTVNSTKDVAVYSMAPPLPTAPAFIGYQGQSDVSLNDGSYNFAVGGGIATGLVQVPLVHPNFGNARALLGVRETAPVVLGTAYPNPANTEVHIPLALQQSGNANVVLSNAVGQSLRRMDLGKLTAGVWRLATIPTGELPEGIYFYTVSTEGGQVAGRVVIRH